MESLDSLESSIKYPNCLLPGEKQSQSAFGFVSATYLGFELRQFRRCVVDDVLDVLLQLGLHVAGLITARLVMAAEQLHLKERNRAMKYDHRVLK